MKIAVAGLGYVGLSNAALLSKNHKVVAVDIDEERVKLVQEFRSPIVDSDLEEYLSTKPQNLTATTDAEAAYKGADFIVIATPTNYDPESNFLILPALSP